MNRTVLVEVFKCLKILSIICFLATAVIFTIVPFINDITGKSFAMHCVSFAIAHSLRLCENKNILWLNALTEYFLLLAYSWLIVMWVNIFLVIKINIKDGRTLKDNPGMGKILLVGLLAFGIPLLLVMITNCFGDTFCFKIFHCKFFG